MRKHRITDADVAALVTGRAAGARSELEPLAQAIGEFRAAAFETRPQPSAALASRLDLSAVDATAATGISQLNESAFDAETIEIAAPAKTRARSRRGLVRTVFSWITGLGLAAKIALGAGVAVAATAGVGAAGALPPGLQDTFDEVVSTVVPTADETDDGTEEPGDVTEPGDGTEDPAEAGYDPADGNFGSWVSEQAKNKPGTGQEFGEMVSEEAKNKPHGKPAQVEEGDDAGESGDVSGDDASTDGGARPDRQPGSAKNGH